SDSRSAMLEYSESRSALYLRSAGPRQPVQTTGGNARRRSSTSNATWTEQSPVTATTAVRRTASGASWIELTTAAVAAIGTVIAMVIATITTTAIRIFCGSEKQNYERGPSAGEGACAPSPFFMFDLGEEPRPWSLGTPLPCASLPSLWCARPDARS